MACASDFEFWRTTGAAFQMDQTASADQSALRHERECGEDANLDCATSVCVGSHRAQTAGAGIQLVSNPTNSQPHAFRENARFMRPSANGPGRELGEHIN